MESAPPAAGRRPVRRAEVTEGQLNAWIRCRIVDEGEPVMRELRLKLLAANRVEGLTVLDFSGHPLPGGLRPRMTLLFAGRLESDGGRARLRLDDLFLEDRKVPLALLDLVADLSARIQGTEPVRLADWVALPYGMIDVRTAPGRLIATY